MGHRGPSLRLVATVVCTIVVVVAVGVSIRSGSDANAGEFAQALVQIDGAPTPTPTVGPTPRSQPTPTVTPTLRLAPMPVPTPTPFVLDRAVRRRLPGHWTPAARVGAARAAGPTRNEPTGGVLGRWIGGSRWRYRGVLGRLDPDQEVVGAVAAAVVDQPRRFPLTGETGRVPQRRAVIVKIDNVPGAQPQVALNDADIVVEELVEGAMTRLAAVFHSRLPTMIGPVRSARSTDIGIAASFNRPILANSGANGIFGALVADAPLIDRGNAVFGGYWRQGGRPAPHNLFTNGRNLLHSVDRPTGAPRPQFAYRAAGEALHPGARSATTIRLRYAERGRGPSVRYRWDDRLDGWRREQFGSPHVDADGQVVAPENVVVWFVPYIDTGLTDKWGEVLYEGVSIGAGDALVFTDGHVIRARWTRPSLRSVATFTDARGRHIELTPGQTWVSLVARGGATWN